MTPTWAIADDYDIKVQDATSGDYISLSTEGYCAVRFDAVGSPDLREAVYEASGGDGMHFGREYYGAVNWTISGSIFGGVNRRVPGSSTEVWNSWSLLSRAWINYPERSLPRAVKPLFFRRPGREQMVVYGRPGRIDPDTKTSHSGFISYTATYRQSDPRFFSAAESSVSISLASNYLGGLQLNTERTALALPFRTSVPNLKSARVTNSGDMPTDPVISFNGPVTNPTLRFAGEDGSSWQVSVRASIPANDTVFIDTRQWARYITSVSGASYAGSYNGPKLQDLKIPKGSHSVFYSGTDLTGTSSCQLKLRNAWSSS